MSELWASSHVVVATGAVGALPDIPYVGLCFTMPYVLWPIFRQNRNLLQDLAALGAAAIQEWVKARYGVRLHVLVVTHTFGRHLNFHPHLHILISRGGLQESEGRWIPTLSFEKQGIMQIWREALIAYLWEALKATELKVDLNRESVRAILKTQYGRNLEHLHRSLPVKITVLAICRPVH